MIAAGSIPAVAYLRRSTDRQEQSLGDQRTEILRWSGAHGFNILHEYIDDAISGTDAANRPAFQKMIRDAQGGGGGGFRAIIVWNSDRFSRGDVTETEHYRYLLRQAGVSVHSVTEDYLARDGIDGDVLRAVKQFQNRQFSVSLSQNTLRGQLSSVLNASDPGRIPPYGYDREVVGPDGMVLYRVRFGCGGGGSGGREVFDRDGKLTATYQRGQSHRKPGKECTSRLVLSTPERVQTVRDIFRMCAEGIGFRSIADELNRRGIPSPNYKLWSFTTVKTILLNPVYRGDMVWNRRTGAKFFGIKVGRIEPRRLTHQGTRVHHLGPDDWVTLPNAVPALVDRALWERAQHSAARRAEACFGCGTKVRRWLLSGVLRCACCGHRYWGVNQQKGRIPGRSNSKKVVTPYYICAGRTKHGKGVCPQPIHVKAPQLESWVLARLQEIVFADGEGVEAAIELFIAQVGAQRADLGEARRLEKEMAEIEGRIRALVEGLDPANIALVNEELTRLRRRKEEMQRRILALKAASEALDETSLRSWAWERIAGLAAAIEGRRDEYARRVMASYIGRDSHRSAGQGRCADRQW